MKFGRKVIEWEASDETFGARHNMVRRGPIARLGADSRVSFADGWQAENVDVVVYATGYHYTFPFLQNAGLITVEDNRLALLGSSVIGWPYQLVETSQTHAIKVEMHTPRHTGEQSHV